MIKNMALKIGMHVILSHSVARKKNYVLFAKARHVVLKGFPWSLTITIPLPTGSKRLFAKPQSVTAMTRKDSRIHWRREGKRSS